VHKVVAVVVVFSGFQDPLDINSKIPCPSHVGEKILAVVVEGVVFDSVVSAKRIPSEFEPGEGELDPRTGCSQDIDAEGTPGQLQLSLTPSGDKDRA
jgi:hypothetical protein